MGDHEDRVENREDFGALSVFAVAESMGEHFDIAELQVGLAIFKALYESNKAPRYYDPRTPPNAIMINHYGMEDTGSPHCLKYMEQRTNLKMGGALFAGVGKLASPGTGNVDVGGILQHSNAVASTSAHLYNLRAIAKRYPKSQTIGRWIRLLIKCKMMKAGVRTVQLGASAVPVASAVPLGWIGIASDVATGLSKLGIKVTMGGTVNQVAMQLHWRAYREMRLTAHLGGSADKPNGPASAVYYEIFRRRGATRIFGQYNVPAMILEPAGYLPLRDKIMMI